MSLSAKNRRLAVVLDGLQEAGSCPEIAVIGRRLSAIS